MRTIAFDIMGSDADVTIAINAALEFVEKNLNYTFILVGDSDQITKVTKETERIKIIDAKRVVNVKSGALISRDSDTSMAVAIRLVNDKKADAVISAGSSAAYLGLCSLILRRLEQIKRPAFMPIFPTSLSNKKFIMLDCGANIEVDAEMIVQWAKLGVAFCQTVLQINKPSVGIVNIGTEDDKGLNFAKEANQILKKNKQLNYHGFVEPRDLLQGIIDVAVIDGYGGNLVLKTIEGTALTMVKLIRSTLREKFIYKLGAVFSKGALYKIKETFDYRNVGGAWVLGVNGVAVKAHGASDKKAFLGAFNQIALALENNALDSFKKALANE